MAKNIPSKKTIFIVAVVLSIIIYFLGVLSGLYANKLIEKKVELDLDQLKGEIDVASLDLKNMLLLQELSKEMTDECRFSELYLGKLRQQLEQVYWKKLPSRLEAYELQGGVTEEYTTLKREYTRILIRMWLIAKNIYEKCHSDLIPILYFYSSNCTSCVEQGQIFDQLKVRVEEKGKSLVVFPIDVNFDDDSVYLLKEYYNISSVPSAVIQDTVISDTLIPLSTLIYAVE